MTSIADFSLTTIYSMIYVDLGPVSRKPRKFFGPGCKTIFSLSVSKNREVYTPETSCILKGNHCSYYERVNKTALYYRKVQDFAMALRAQKVSGAFEKRVLGHGLSMIAASRLDGVNFRQKCSLIRREFTNRLLI